MKESDKAYGVQVPEKEKPEEESKPKPQVKKSKVESDASKRRSLNLWGS